jgi:3',5'-cyclic-AMP phosphodiesterase
VNILWITDPHWNFLRKPEATRIFGEYIRSENEFDRVLITGDIAEAPSLKPLLNLFAEGVGKDKPIDFVLGNHDHYSGSIAYVNEGLRSGLAPNLTWLDNAEPILLDDDTALVGHFAWYDAILGNGIKSDVVLHDFMAIAEFRPHYHPYEWANDADHGSRNGLLRELIGQARLATNKARAKLVKALQLRKHVIFGTHVPPFAGACWHEGQISNDDWLPWFTCATMGNMLADVAAKHPDNKILCLCGHTHSSGEYQHYKNLVVLTGKSEYGAPDVAGLITEESFSGDRWKHV